MTFFELVYAMIFAVAFSAIMVILFDNVIPSLFELIFNTMGKAFLDDHQRIL